MRSGRRAARGFTLLELLVVLAIIGTLLSLAAPRYLRSIDKAKEAVLRENLSTIRATLDRFHADTGAYPASLEELVARHYLRQVPEDPFTGSAASWRLQGADGGAQAAVSDVRSGAPGKSVDGVAYREW